MIKTIIGGIIAIVAGGILLSFWDRISEFVLGEVEELLLTIWVKPITWHLLKNAKNGISQLDDLTYIVGINEKEELFIIQKGKLLNQQNQDSPGTCPPGNTRSENVADGGSPQANQNVEDRPESQPSNSTGEEESPQPAAAEEETNPPRPVESGSLEDRVEETRQSRPADSVKPELSTSDVGVETPKLEMPGDSISRDTFESESFEDRVERETTFPSSEKREIPQIFKAGETFDSQELDVTESRFCLEMMRPECKVSADVAEISLLDIRTIKDNVRKIFFWTSMKASQGSQNVVHVWSSSERPDAWYEAVHISIGDKISKFPMEDKIRLKERLLDIKEASPNIHAVQAVVLSLDPSSRFRTYSSLRAVPGKYSVEVWHPDRLQVVSGGEAKTILIKSPSESN